MGVALLLCLTQLPKDEPTRARVAISAPIRALSHRGPLTVSVSACFYNYGFFTILAWTPFVLGWGGDYQLPFLVAVGVVALGAVTLAIGRRAVGETRVVPAIAPAIADAT